MKSFKTFLSEQEQKPFKFYSPADPDTGKPAQIMGKNITDPKNSPESFYSQRGVIQQGTNQGLIQKAKIKAQPGLDFINKNKGSLAGAAASIGVAALTRGVGNLFGGGQQQPQQPSGLDPSSPEGRRYAASLRVADSMKKGPTAPTKGVSQDSNNGIKVPRTSFTEPTGVKNA